MTIPWPTAWFRIKLQHWSATVQWIQPQVTKLVRANDSDLDDIAGYDANEAAMHQMVGDLQGRQGTCKFWRHCRWPQHLTTAVQSIWPLFWIGKDSGASLALAIDCSARELLGWHMSRLGRAITAAGALERALICWFGTLGRNQCA